MTTADSSTKEKRNAYMKIYRLKNKEKVKESQKRWRQNNPGRIAEYNKIWRHDKYAIANWKTSGIKLRENEDWESVYLQWFCQENCTDCQCRLTYRKIGRTWRCLDHDHETGFIRDIICHRCNILRG